MTRTVEVGEDESAQDYTEEGEYVSNVHYSASNNETATISEGYPCPDCTEVFETKQGLTGHKSAHSDDDESSEEEEDEGGEEE